MSIVKYRPEIDGLRAIAVLPVIFFHMGSTWIPGGFIGVDVFFVISGYLITQIVLKEAAQGSFTLRGFWMRRIRRIIPALTVMIGVTLLGCLLIMYKPDLYQIGRQGLGSAFSLANIYFWLSAGDYWGFSAENSPLLHTWTLSVEEQFYLFYPLFLFLSLKYFRRSYVNLMTLIVVISLSLFIWGTKNYPTATFYLLPTRAWELGLGCVLGMLDFNNRTGVYERFKSRAVDSLAFFGLVLIFASYLLIDGSNGLSFSLIFPVVGAVLVIAFLRNTDSSVYQLLTSKPIVYIGKISYSLYLWHWPVFFFAKNIFVDGKPIASRLSVLPLVVITSMLSYHLIEKTTRYRKNAIGFIAVAFAGLVFFSFSLTQQHLAEDISMFSTTTWKGGLYNVAPNKECSDFVWRRMLGIDEPQDKDMDRNSYAKGGV